MTTPGIPFVVRLMRLLFKGLCWLWPAAAASVAYRIWFRSPRYPQSKRELNWQKTASLETVNLAGRAVKVYRWGALSAGYVLLVHGWSGRATQLGAFVNAINQTGLGVLAFDAPGHGLSEGKATTIYEISSVINQLCQKYSLPKVIISHSFGGMASALAMREHELKISKVVTISCPVYLENLLAGFKSYLQLSDKVMQLLDEKFFMNFSPNIYTEVSASQNLLQHDKPLLIIHDKDDKIVNWRQSEKLHAAIPGAKLIYTNGLGHTRILRDKSVIKNVVEFIKQD